MIMDDDALLGYYEARPSSNKIKMIIIKDYTG